jgi:hypothetical protein
MHCGNVISGKAYNNFLNWQWNSSKIYNKLGVEINEGSHEECEFFLFTISGDLLNNILIYKSLETTR